jgi:hypothetical protein
MMAEARVLVGVTEIAEMLGVSKQRASVLCARKGFPDPVERVAPVDAMTVEIMRGMFSEDGTVSLDDAVEALQSRSYRLGPGKKLWRLADVARWAEREGRTLRIDDE